MMTRRGLLAGLLAWPGLGVPAKPCKHYLALVQVKRRAEEWGGRAIGSNEPSLPPKGSIYREFWDIADKGMR